MKKIVTITINKTTFNIDEDAYDLLSSYLNDLNQYFDNLDNNEKEIIEDIEARISELLTKKIIRSVKEVINIDDVKEIIKTLGNVEDFENSEKTDADTGKYKNNNSRFLFRDIDGSILGGVAAGLGSYLHIDPLWVRIAFVILTLIHGFGIILYIILWAVIPAAKTTAEKLQMKGKIINISNIEKTVSKESRRIKEKATEYKKSEEFKRLKTNLNNILHSLGTIFIFLFKFLIKLIGIIILVGGIILLVIFLIRFSFNINDFHYKDISLNHFSAYINHIDLFHLCIIILIGIPVLGILIAIFKFLFGIKSKNSFFRGFGFTIWIIAFILFILLLFRHNFRAPVSVSYLSTEVFQPPYKNTMNINLNSGEYKNLAYYNILNKQVIYDPENEIFLGTPVLNIEKSDSDSIECEITKRFHFGIFYEEKEDIDDIYFRYSIIDSTVRFNPYYSYDEDIVWKIPELEILLKIPENTRIIISKEACNIIENFNSEDFLLKSELKNKELIMNHSGLKALK